MLTAFIEGAQELSRLTPQFIPEDFSYSPEPTSDDDLADCVVPVRAHRTGVASMPVYTVAECQADAAIAAQEESAESVDRALASTARHMTPSVAYDHCHNVLTCEEFGNRSRLHGAEYRADLHLAAKRALWNEPVLWQLHQLIQDGAADGIPTWVLARSPQVQQLKYLVGAECLRRKLHNTSWYFG